MTGLKILKIAVFGGKYIVMVGNSSSWPKDHVQVLSVDQVTLFSISESTLCCCCCCPHSDRGNDHDRQRF